MNSNNPNPYVSPAQIASKAAARDAGTPTPRAVKHPYQSASRLAVFTMVMLGVGIVIDILSAGSSYMQVQLLQRAHSGDEYTVEEADANDAREALVGLAGLGCYVLTAIGFLMWFYRAHRNLPALGATQLDYSPGWAVGSFFVPILNLFRPYQIMKEVWQNSSLRAENSSTAMVGLWWGAWIIGCIMGQISLRLGLAAESLEALIAATWMDLAGCLVSPVAALLAINVVRTITRLQDECHEDMEVKTPGAAFVGGAAY